MNNNIDFVTPFKKQTRVAKFVRFLLRFFYDFEISGLENLKNLPENKGVIFAPFHSGFLDIVFIPSSLCDNHHLFPFFYLIRTMNRYREFFAKWILGGEYIKSWGAYSSSPPFHNTLFSYFQSMKTHLEIIESGKSLIIYPEGAIRNGRWNKKHKKPLRAQPGVSILAFLSGCPVVPVLIKLKNSGLKKFFPFWDKAKIKFGKPLFFDQLFNNKITGENFDDFLKVSSFIVKKIDELDDL